MAAIVTLWFVGGPKRRQELDSSISSSLQLYSKRGSERNKNIAGTDQSSDPQLTETLQEHAELKAWTRVVNERNQPRTMKQNQLMYRTRTKAGDQGTKNRCNEEAGRQREQVKTIHRLKHDEGTNKQYRNEAINK
ncbi:hypothetical protein ATANTOWER_027172 [Ataeniobius toweri]|uniref:Uncharacterized protein n=1 Tax=Ataeniobius toweri TaxID=208326 RepID=A0ABU7BLA3_9TELE|nr:hypothetical protein [Ataeniobius toweri]